MEVLHKLKKICLKKQFVQFLKLESTLIYPNCHNMHIVFKIFDATIVPILIYGGEI